MRTKLLLAEALEKHRDIKKKMMALLEKSNTPNMSKAKMQDDLFKIYMELK